MPLDFKDTKALDVLGVLRFSAKVYFLSTKTPHDLHKPKHDDGFACGEPRRPKAATVSDAQGAQA